MSMDKNTSVIFKTSCSDFRFGIADWSDMGYKKPVLFVQHENQRWKVASFGSEKDADFFVKALKGMLWKGGDENA